MKCPACSAENSEGNRFCAICGSKLQLTCPKCGVPCDPNLHFCGACGAKLDEAGNKAVDEVQPHKASIELAERWVTEFKSIGWGPEVFEKSIRNELTENIRLGDGEGIVFAGKSSLDLHIFLRGFDASDMLPVAGFVGTNHRLIILTSKMGSLKLDPVLQIGYEELRGVMELKEAEARKDMREVEGLLRISLQGEDEPVDLLVLNKKARTPLLGFLQTASSMAIAAPTDLQQATLQSPAFEAKAKEAQDAVKAVSQGKPVARKTSRGESEEPSSQQGQHSSPKTRLEAQDDLKKEKVQSKRNLGIGCIVVFVAAFVIFIVALGTCGKGSNSPTTYTVKYEVTGSATSASLTYQNRDGGTSQESNSYLPWTYSFTAVAGDFLYISAQNDGEYGSVTVTIYLNGTQVKTSTSSGAYVIATASGSA